MAVGRIPLSEALDLPVAFEVTNELFESGRASLEASLREHGWKGNSQPVAASAHCDGYDGFKDMPEEKHNDEK